LSWLQSLLPIPLKHTKHSTTALNSNWQLFLIADNPSGELTLNPRERLPVLGLDEAWTVEVSMVNNISPCIGVSDAIIQKCLSYIVGLELNRQGWAMVDGRYLRIPAGCSSSNSVPAVKLELTVTQQREVCIYFNVAHVKFNAIQFKSGEMSDINFSERIVSQFCIASAVR
jgi:hypothetical protein